MDYVLVYHIPVYYVKSKLEYLLYKIYYIQVYVLCAYKKVQVAK
jgi:hypothetical protein